MARVCLKCNYERTPNELAPETECPQCGAIYAKVEKALRPPEAVPQNPPPGAAPQTPESSEQKMVELTANNHLNVFSLFIACF